MASRRAVIIDTTPDPHALGGLADRELLEALVEQTRTLNQRVRVLSNAVRTQSSLTEPEA